MNNLKKNNAVNNDNLRVYEGLGSITGKLLDKVVGEFNKSTQLIASFITSVGIVA